MRRLVKSLENVDWTEPQAGVREKSLEVGDKLIRLLEIEGLYESDSWCETGHTGFVIEGGFDLDINGDVSRLDAGSVFFVEQGRFEHRHIPTVREGEKVSLLLVEEPVQ